MATLTGAKGYASVYPDGAIETPWNRLEPLITPEQVRTRHLFGIPLYSNMKDPVTGKAAHMTDDIIQDVIIRAVSLAETEAMITIFPVEYKYQWAFDRVEYEAFGFAKIPKRPIASVSRLSVMPANGIEVYRVPLEWISVSYLTYGQINIVPLTVGLINGAQGFEPIKQASGGSVFLSVYASRSWMPAFWEIECQLGWPDGNLPRIINELIGTICAIEILSILAATYARTTSTSLGIDAMSQSISTPGPTLWQIRIQELTEKKQMLINKIKGLWGLKLFSGNC